MCEAQGPWPDKDGVREARGRPTCPHAPWEPMCFLEGGMGRGGASQAGSKQPPHSLSTKCMLGHRDASHKTEPPASRNSACP